MQRARESVTRYNSLARLIDLPTLADFRLLIGGLPIGLTYLMNLGWCTKAELATKPGREDITHKWYNSDDNKNLEKWNLELRELMKKTQVFIASEGAFPMQFIDFICNFWKQEHKKKNRIVKPLTEYNLCQLLYGIKDEGGKYIVMLKQP